MIDANFFIFLLLFVVRLDAVLHVVRNLLIVVVRLEVEESTVTLLGRRIVRIAADEDPLCGGAGQVREGDQGQFAGEVALFLALEALGDEAAAAVEDVAPLVLERELAFPLVENVLDGQRDVILEAGAVTHVVQAFGRQRSVALAALDHGLGIGEEDLGVADVVPGRLRVRVVAALVQALADLEAVERTVGIVDVLVQLVEEGILVRG